MKRVPTLDPITNKIHKKFLPTTNDGDSLPEVRSDVSSPYAYMGTSNRGVLESAPFWKIHRIHMTNQTTEVAFGAWVDRLTLTYESE